MGALPYLAPWALVRFALCLCLNINPIRMVSFWNWNILRACNVNSKHIYLFWTLDFICLSVVVPKFDDASLCIIQIWNIFLIYCSVETEHWGFYLWADKVKQACFVSGQDFPPSANQFTYLPQESLCVCVFLVSRVKCVGWCGLYLGSPPSLQVNTGHLNASPFPYSPAVTRHSPPL